MELKSALSWQCRWDTPPQLLCFQTGSSPSTVAGHVYDRISGPAHRCEPAFPLSSHPIPIPTLLQRRILQLCKCMLRRTAQRHSATNYLARWYRPLLSRRRRHSAGTLMRSAISLARGYPQVAITDKGDAITRSIPHGLRLCGSRCYCLLKTFRSSPPLCRRRRCHPARRCTECGR